MERVVATMLLDYYGNLLTEKQYLLCDLYYNSDYSFSEIAEMEGISRQAVRDAIIKAQNSLENYEEKTGYVKRDQSLRRIEATIREAAEKISESEDPAAANNAMEILRALDSFSDCSGKEGIDGI